VLLDAGRYTRLVDAGWRIHRFTKYQVYAEPDEIVATIGMAGTGSGRAFTSLSRARCVSARARRRRRSVHPAEVVGPPG